MKRIRNLAVLSAFVALAGTSAYAQQDERSTTRHAKELTKQQALQRASKRFDKADLDQDGTLTEDEMKKARQRMQERKHARDQKQQERRSSQ